MRGLIENVIIIVWPVQHHPDQTLTEIKWHFLDVFYFLDAFTFRSNVHKKTISYCLHIMYVKIISTVNIKNTVYISIWLNKLLHYVLLMNNIHRALFSLRAHGHCPQEILKYHRKLWQKLLLTVHTELLKGSFIIISCQIEGFPAGNAHAPAGKITPWIRLPFSDEVLCLILGIVI